MSGGRAITIGVFDGVHLGHVALVKAARSAAGGGEVVAISFDPHPLRVLRPDDAPAMLSSFEQRRQWLMEAGADEVVAVRPTREFLGQSPQEFLAWLVDEYRPSVIVEGSDFGFGRDRAGTEATLRAGEASHRYRTIIIDDVEAALADQSMVRATSSLIRWLIRQGRVRDAALLAGRPYEIRGEVIRGDGRGRELLGVPTANLAHGEYLLPGDGIYIGVGVRADAGPVRCYPAAISVGAKPSFGGKQRVTEAHLIGYEGPADDYGWTMHLRFHDWLRDQIAYERVDGLVDQMSRDIEKVGEVMSDE